MFETIKSQLYIGKTLVQQNELEGRGFSMKLDVTDNSIKATLTAKADITMQSLEISTEKDFDDDDLFFANGYQAWTTSREFSKKDTFNDVINYLIDYYKENEEFTDEEADYYNKEIEKFEQGNFEEVTEITLEDLEKRITLLEQEIKDDL